MRTALGHYGSEAVEYVVERNGISRPQQLLQRMGEGLPFAEAFQEAFRIDLATFQQNVQDLLIRGY